MSIERDDLRVGTCKCHLGLKVAVIVEGLSTLRRESRKAAATSVSIRCRLSKASVDKGGSVGIILDAGGFVAIANV